MLSLLIMLIDSKQILNTQHSKPIATLNKLYQSYVTGSVWLFFVSAICFLCNYLVINGCYCITIQNTQNAWVVNLRSVYVQSWVLARIKYWIDTRTLLHCTIPDQLLLRSWFLFATSCCCENTLPPCQSISSACLVNVIAIPACWFLQDQWCYFHLYCFGIFLKYFCRTIISRISFPRGNVLIDVTYVLVKIVFQFFKYNVEDIQTISSIRILNVLIDLTLRP